MRSLTKCVRANTLMTWLRNGFHKLSIHLNTQSALAKNNFYITFNHLLQKGKTPYDTLMRAKIQLEGNYVTWPQKPHRESLVVCFYFILCLANKQWSCIITHSCGFREFFPWSNRSHFLLTYWFNNSRMMFAEKFVNH